MNQDEKSVPTLAAEDGQELHTILAELREGMTRIELTIREIISHEAKD